MIQLLLLSDELLLVPIERLFWAAAQPDWDAPQVIKVLEAIVMLPGACVLKRVLKSLSALATGAVASRATKAAAAARRGVNRSLVFGIGRSYTEAIRMATPVSLGAAALMHPSTGSPCPVMIG